MAVSLRKIRDSALIFVLLAIPLLLLRSTTRSPHQLGAFDRAIRRIGAPLEAAMSYSAGMMGSLFERWVLQARMQDENDVLRRENRELKGRLHDAVELEEENQELRRALQMRDKVAEDMIAAERIGVDQSPFFRVISIRIDRGHHFVHPEMAVLAPDGVVGRIDKAFDDYSDVMLITDPRSRVAVEITRTNAQGILQGDGEDSCVVEISKDYEVQIGDLVQTSGVDELFPEGHPVGQVTAVEDLVADKRLVHVLPAVRFDRLDAVWVVLASAPEPDPMADKSDEPVQARGWHPVE